MSKWRVGTIVGMPVYSNSDESHFTADYISHFNLIRDLILVANHLLTLLYQQFNAKEMTYFV